MPSLRVEQLEGRLLAGGAQPTDLEQLFLELLNAARANPAAYGASIGLDLGDVDPSAPLAFNTKLIRAARDHSVDMRDRAYFGHDTPEGLDAGDRIEAEGYNWTAWSESIAAGFDSPAAALEALIIDAGISGEGHRRHLLDMDPTPAGQLEIGIGIALGGTQYQNYYTIDTARDYFLSEPHNVFLTGVVYDDADNNHFYSVGEGFDGVTITASGHILASATTFHSGGYSLALPDGTYQVTASGPGFPAQSQLVTISGTNLKLDFLAGDPVMPPSPSDRLAVWRGWWLMDSNGNWAWDGTAGGDSAASFGDKRMDVPVAFDWDGDGHHELALFRRGRDLLVDRSGDGAWQKLDDFRRRFGNGGDQLVAADWNGDGRDDVAVLHDETGRLHIDTNGDRRLNSQDLQTRFIKKMLATDRLIAGDWDGDGDDDIGLFRRSSNGGMFFLLDGNDNYSWDGNRIDRRISFEGPANSKPAPANFDSDPATEVAGFSKGRFYVDMNNDGHIDNVFAFAGGLYPVPGQWG